MQPIPGYNKYIDIHDYSEAQMNLLVVTIYIVTVLFFF